MKGIRTSGKIKYLCFTIVMVAFFTIAAVFPVSAWFYSSRRLAVYAPISSPESLFIGAGHKSDDSFEDIRYFYFDAMNPQRNEEDDGVHWDKVFCVYGKMVSGYKLQLGFTTNNQFTYEIYNATESSVSSEGAVAYTTHTETPQTYYYSINGAALAGTYLNKDGDRMLADDTKHTATYGSYNEVHPHAEPLYWQTTSRQAGNVRGDFVNYYIIRIKFPSDLPFDRESDVICISAKSFSV